MNEREQEQLAYLLDAISASAKVDKQSVVERFEAEYEKLVAERDERINAQAKLLLAQEKQVFEKQIKSENLAQVATLQADMVRLRAEKLQALYADLDQEVAAFVGSANYLSQMQHVIATHAIPKAEWLICCSREDTALNKWCLEQGYTTNHDVILPHRGVQLKHASKHQVLDFGLDTRLQQAKAWLIEQGWYQVGSGKE